MFYDEYFWKKIQEWRRGNDPPLLPLNMWSFSSSVSSQQHPQSPLPPTTWAARGGVLYAVYESGWRNAVSMWSSDETGNGKEFRYFGGWEERWSLLSLTLFCQSGFCGKSLTFWETRLSLLRWSNQHPAGGAVLFLNDKLICWTVLLWRVSCSYVHIFLKLSKLFP